MRYLFNSTASGESRNLIRRVSMESTGGEWRGQIALGLWAERGVWAEDRAESGGWPEMSVVFSVLIPRGEGQGDDWHFRLSGGKMLSFPNFQFSGWFETSLPVKCWKQTVYYQTRRQCCVSSRMKATVFFRTFHASHLPWLYFVILQVTQWSFDMSDPSSQRSR